MVEREKKPMKYKMICCDLDGTLLNNQSQVDVENLQALKELADEVICSNEEHAVVYVLNHYF